MRYLVEIEVPHYQAVVVEADSEEDAADKAADGQGVMCTRDVGAPHVWVVQEVKCNERGPRLV